MFGEHERFRVCHCTVSAASYSQLTHSSPTSASVTQNVYLARAKFPCTSQLHSSTPHKLSPLYEHNERNEQSAARTSNSTYFPSVIKCIVLWKKKKRRTDAFVCRLRRYFNCVMYVFVVLYPLQMRSDTWFHMLCVLLRMLCSLCFRFWVVLLCRFVQQQQQQ